MLFVLLTIFTEDNTGQLTRQTISWDASTLCCEGLSDQCQTSIRPVMCVVPSFNGHYQAVCPGSTAWAPSNTQWSQEESCHWLWSVLAAQCSGRKQLLAAASSALCHAGLCGVCSGANLQGVREENRGWRWGGFPETLLPASRDRKKKTQI